MALGSTVVIWSAGGEAARRAGMRYVIVHLLGGVLLMAGIIDFVADKNTIAFGIGPDTGSADDQSSGDLADPGRISDQRWSATPLRLAPRRLP